MPLNKNELLGELQRLAQNASQVFPWQNNNTENPFLNNSSGGSSVSPLKNPFEVDSNSTEFNPNGFGYIENNVNRTDQIATVNPFKIQQLQQGLEVFTLQLKEFLAENNQNIDWQFEAEIRNISYQVQNLLQNGVASPLAINQISNNLEKVIGMARSSLQIDGNLAGENQENIQPSNNEVKDTFQDLQHDIPEEEIEPKTQVEPKPESKLETELENEIEVEIKTEPKPKPETKLENKNELENQTELEPETQTKTESQIESESQIETKLENENQTELETETPKADIIDDNQITKDEEEIASLADSNLKETETKSDKTTNSLFSEQDLKNLEEEVKKIFIRDSNRNSKFQKVDLEVFLKKLIQDKLDSLQRQNGKVLNPIDRITVEDGLFEKLKKDAEISKILTSKNQSELSPEEQKEEELRSIVASYYDQNYFFEPTKTGLKSDFSQIIRSKEVGLNVVKFLNDLYKRGFAVVTGFNRYDKKLHIKIYAIGLLSDFKNLGLRKVDDNRLKNYLSIFSKQNRQSVEFFGVSYLIAVKSKSILKFETEEILLDAFVSKKIPDLSQYQSETDSLTFYFDSNKDYQEFEKKLFFNAEFETDQKPKEENPIDLASAVGVVAAGISAGIKPKEKQKATIEDIKNENKVDKSKSKNVSGGKKIERRSLRGEVTKQILEEQPKSPVLQKEAVEWSPPKVEQFEPLNDGNNNLNQEKQEGEIDKFQVWFDILFQKVKAEVLIQSYLIDGSNNLYQDFEELIKKIIDKEIRSLELNQNEVLDPGLKIRISKELLDKLLKSRGFVNYLEKKQKENQQKNQESEIVEENQEKSSIKNPQIPTSVLKNQEDEQKNKPSDPLADEKKDKKDQGKQGNIHEQKPKTEEKIVENIPKIKEEKEESEIERENVKQTSEKIAKIQQKNQEEKIDIQQEKKQEKPIKVEQIPTSTNEEKIEVEDPLADEIKDEKNQNDEDKGFFERSFVEETQEKPKIVENQKPKNEDNIPETEENNSKIEEKPKTQDEENVKETFEEIDNIQGKEAETEEKIVENQGEKPEIEPETIKDFSEEIAEIQTENEKKQQEEITEKTQERPLKIEQIPTSVLSQEDEEKIEVEDPLADKEDSEEDKKDKDFLKRSFVDKKYQGKQGNIPEQKPKTEEKIVENIPEIKQEKEESEIERENVKQTSEKIAEIQEENQEEKSNIQQGGNQEGLQKLDENNDSDFKKDKANLPLGVLGGVAGFGAVAGTTPVKSFNFPKKVTIPKRDGRSFIPAFVRVLPKKASNLNARTSGASNNLAGKQPTGEQNQAISSNISGGINSPISQERAINNFTSFASSHVSSTSPIPSFNDRPKTTAQGFNRKTSGQEFGASNLKTESSYHRETRGKEAYFNNETGNVEFLKPQISQSVGGMGMGFGASNLDRDPKNIQRLKEEIDNLQKNTQNLSAKELEKFWKLQDELKEYLQENGKVEASPEVQVIEKAIERDADEQNRALEQDFKELRNLQKEQQGRNLGEEHRRNEFSNLEEIVNNPEDERGSDSEVLEKYGKLKEEFEPKVENQEYENIRSQALEQNKLDNQENRQEIQAGNVEAKYLKLPILGKIRVGNTPLGQGGEMGVKDLVDSYNLNGDDVNNPGGLKQKFENNVLKPNQIKQGVDRLQRVTRLKQARIDRDQKNDNVKFEQLKGDQNNLKNQIGDTEQSIQDDDKLLQDEGISDERRQEIEGQKKEKETKLDELKQKFKDATNPKLYMDRAKKAAARAAKKLALQAISTIGSIIVANLWWIIPVLLIFSIILLLLVITTAVYCIPMEEPRDRIFEPAIYNFTGSDPLILKQIRVVGGVIGFKVPPTPVREWFEKNIPGCNGGGGNIECPVGYVAYEKTGNTYRRITNASSSGGSGGGGGDGSVTVDIEGLCQEAKQFLGKFAENQAKWEGWSGGRGIGPSNVPNDCNNPGNINEDGEILAMVDAKFGKGKYKLNQPECESGPNFHVWFETPEIGMYYYQQFTFLALSKPSGPYANAKTIGDWLDTYCPPSGGCDSNYKTNVLEGTGKSPNTPMSEISNILNCTTDSNINNTIVLNYSNLANKSNSFNIFNPVNSYSTTAKKINPFGGLSVEANESDQAIRDRVSGYYEKGEFYQVEPQTDTEEGIKNGNFDINLVKYLDNLHRAGFAVVTGPFDWGRGYGRHMNPSSAVDIWGLGKLSDIQSGGPIKGLKTSGIESNLAGGEPDEPAVNGNTLDPRIRRHVDTPVDEVAVELYSKAIDVLVQGGVRQWAMVNPAFQEKTGKGDEANHAHKHHLHAGIYRVDEGKEYQYSDGISAPGGGDTGSTVSSGNIWCCPVGQNPTTGNIETGPTGDNYTVKSTEEGEASTYGEGDGFAGQQTANGETFDPNQLTAAHKTLPFDTMVRVTNKANNKSVIVRINDRGPYSGDRIIDLSTKAAGEIGMDGVADVKLEILEENKIAFNSLFGGIKVNAANDIQAERERLAKLFEEGKISSQDSRDVPNIRNGGFKDNLVLVMLKLYDSGITFRGGASNGPDRGYGGHGSGESMDFFAFYRGDDYRKGSEPSTIKFVDTVNSDPEAFKLVEEAVNIMKGSSVLNESQLIGPDSMKTAGIVEMNSFDAASNHEDHIHIQVDSSKTFNSSGVTPGSSTTNTGATDGCGCVRPTGASVGNTSGGDNPTQGTFGSADNVVSNPDQFVAAVLSILESPTAQGRLDVAVVIANRTGNNFGGYGANVRDQAFASGQFQPFFTVEDGGYGIGKNDIQDKNSAIQALVKARYTQDQATAALDEFMKNITNSTMVQDSESKLKDFVYFKGTSMYGNMEPGDFLRQDGENFFHAEDADPVDYKPYPISSVFGNNKQSNNLLSPYSKGLFAKVWGGVEINAEEDKLDLENIAKEVGMQSLVVKDIESGNTDSYNGNQAPASPASAIKIVVAHVLLDEIEKGNISLSESLTMTTDIFTDKEKDDGVTLGSTVSVEKALKEMLQRSSNDYTNVLVKKLGGPSSFNSKASSLGYGATKFNNYLSLPDATVGSNTSNANNITKAMEAVYFGSGTGYGIAQEALRTAKDKFDHSNRVANKIAANTKVIGNTAVVEIEGKNYIITGFANHDGVINGYPNDKYINESFQKVIDALKGNAEVENTDPNSGGAGSDNSSDKPGGCPTGDEPVSGEGGEDGTYTGDAKADMELVQAIKSISSQPCFCGETCRSCCYRAVAEAIDAAGGFGGIPVGFNFPRVDPAKKQTHAVTFGYYLNQPGKLDEYKLRNLKQEGISNPNDPRVPPGAIIVIRQGQSVSDEAGDINIKTDDGKFLNFGDMTNWMEIVTPSEVMGIYVPK